MNEETRALEELMCDFKEHNTKYAKNYEDVCYSAIQSLQQQLKDKDEKISKIIKLLVEMVFDDMNDLDVYQELVARHLVKLGYIVKEDGFYKELETNKED